MVREEKLEPEIFWSVLAAEDCTIRRSTYSICRGSRTVADKSIVSLSSCGVEALGSMASSPYSSRWPDVTVQDTTVAGQSNANWLYFDGCQLILQDYTAQTWLGITAAMMTIVPYKNPDLRQSLDVMQGKDETSCHATNTSLAQSPCLISRLPSSLLTDILDYELSPMLWSFDLRSLYPYIQS